MEGNGERERERERERNVTILVYHISTKKCQTELPESYDLLNTTPYQSKHHTHTHLTDLSSILPRGRVAFVVLVPADVSLSLWGCAMAGGNLYLPLKMICLPSVLRGAGVAVEQDDLVSAWRERDFFLPAVQGSSLISTLGERWLSHYRD